MRLQEKLDHIASTLPEILPQVAHESGNDLEHRLHIVKAIAMVHTGLVELKEIMALRKQAQPDRQTFEKQFRSRILSDSQRYPLLFTREEKERIVHGVYSELFGLGPLDELLADGSITEIMVNRPQQVFVERKGKLSLSDTVFIDDAHVRRIVDAIVSRIGRRIDENSPLVDARLADGSRFNAIIPPLALHGTTVTIRKFSKTPYVVADLIRFGSLTAQAAAFLNACVVGRQNLVISGGTGSGKTTLLNVLSGFIPEGERVITVEDAAELQLKQPHVIPLESRPASPGQRNAITIRELVKNALRMRPDRIVVGECRGGEALDMLQAMNTGHAGSMTTGHANSPKDILKRIETMVLMSGMELPLRAIREQIASALSIIVQQSRFFDGTRKVSHVSEVTHIDEEGNIHVEDIFLFKQSGLGADGKILGTLEPTGYIPKCLSKLQTHDISVPENFFQNPHSDPTLIQYGLHLHTPDVVTLTARDEALLETCLKVHADLINSEQAHGNEAEVPLEKLPENKLRQRIMAEINRLQAAGALPGWLGRDEREQVVQNVFYELRGLGPLEALLETEGLNEILINGPRQVLVRKHGQIEATRVFFHNDKHLRRIISAIVTPLGRRCDDSSPMVDARLPDGSGFNAVLPPLSLRGPVVTIRKFPKVPYGPAHLTQNRTWDENICDFMEKAVRGMLNIVIFGGTGTGKTTLLNVLSGFIPSHDRIITMETIAELRLQQEHVVSLETRESNAEGSGRVTMQDLVKNALRMRPERILIGEVTGGEALDMLQAMNTGHDGSLCTAHANTPEDMLSRLETLVLMSGYDLPIKAIREQIASAIDLLVHVITLPDGSKRIASISEVGAVHPQSQKIQLFPLFVYQPAPKHAGASTLDPFACTGRVPEFLPKLRLNGVLIDNTYFKRTLA